MESLRALIKKHQKVALGLAGVLILYSIYNTFLKAPAETANLTPQAEGIRTLEVGRDIIATLNRLKTISIDPEVLDDPLFRSLFDFSKPLPDFAGGKTNPFIEETPGLGAPSVTPRTDTTLDDQEQGEVSEIETQEPATDPADETSDTTEPAADEETFDASSL